MQNKKEMYPGKKLFKKTVGPLNFVILAKDEEQAHEIYNKVIKRYKETGTFTEVTEDEYMEYLEKTEELKQKRVLEGPAEGDWGLEVSMVTDWY